MDCCKFESQMTRIIPSFAGFTAFTPTIPKMYWDVKSQEQRIFGLCKMLNKVICYADMLGENVDEIAKTLQDIEDGKLDPMIEAAIAQWFKDNEPEIMQDIDDINAKIGSGFDADNTVADAISGIDATLTGFDADNTVADAISGIDATLTGFDADNTVADGFTAEETARNAAIADLKTYFDSNIKDIGWNCKFRNIVASTYDLSLNLSCQGFCMYELNDVLYVAQAVMLDLDEAIILYRYDNGTEAARIEGEYGHINDITYSNGYLYALNDSTRVLYKFTVAANSITLVSSDVLPIGLAAIEITDEGIYIAYSQGLGLGIDITLYESDSFDEILKRYHVPFDGTAVIQGMSVNGNDIFVALTDPNVLVYFMQQDENYYFVNIPQYIGHCFVDEVEGVHIDSEKNLYFNTNSNVDLHLIASVFETNLIHSEQKEVDTSLNVDRYGTISARLDYNTGSLTNPAGYGNSFKLCGDIINYAKAHGYSNIAITLQADYPYPMVINGATVQISVPTGYTYAINGLIAYESSILFVNVSRTKLNPTNIESLVFNSIIYGAYLAKSRLYIQQGTFATPDVAYDADHKRVYMTNGIAQVQDISHYRFMNCIVAQGASTISSTVIHERTVILQHTAQ